MEQCGTSVEGETRQLPNGSRGCAASCHCGPSITAANPLNMVPRQPDQRRKEWGTEFGELSKVATPAGRARTNAPMPAARTALQALICVLVG